MTSLNNISSSDKVKKAIQEFSEQLCNKPEEKRNTILQKVILKFDLSPLEADFLQRQCTKDDSR